MQGNNSQDPPKAGQGKLVQIRDFGKTHPDHCLTDIREYWNAQRNGAAVPLKSDIHAAGIGRSVDFAFVCERIARGMARFRLSGQRLHKFMGMEVRGLPLAALFRLSSRDEFANILESVFSTPQIAELWLNAPEEYARSEMTARMLLLPLRSDLGDISRVLGCLSLSGEPGQTPRRFDLARYKLSPVIPGGTICEPAKTPKPPAPAPSRPVSDSSTVAPVIPTATPEERRKTFTLISNDRIKE